MNKFFLIFYLCLFLLPADAVEDTVSFQSPAQALLYHDLTQQLRCLVCQNETIAESQASLAVDLRQAIFYKIQEGQTKEQILTYLTARYGDFILYQPPWQQNTYLLWGFPGVMLVLGIVVIFLLIIRRRDR